MKLGLALLMTLLFTLGAIACSGSPGAQNESENSVQRESSAQNDSENSVQSESETSAGRNPTLSSVLLEVSTIT